MLCLKDDGNVGIGTASPGTKLEITSLRSNQIRLTSYYTTIQTNEKIGGIEFYSMDDTSAGVKAAIEVLSADQSGTSYMTFSAGTNTEKMRIDKDGNVGIGTTSPESQLQIGDFNGTPHITLAGANNNIASSGIYFAENDEGANPINYGMGIQFDSENNILNIIGDDNGDGTTDKWMTIKRENGNVGIGTTSPHSKLHIDGGYLLISENTNSRENCGVLLVFILLIWELMDIILHQYKHI